MIERLHPHVSKSRSIRCSIALILARGKCQRKNKLVGGGAQASMEPGTANEQCELHVDPLAHLPDVQLCGYFGPTRAHHLGQAGLIGHGRPHC